MNQTSEKILVKETPVFHYVPGLEGVVASQTRLSHVDGLAGELTIAGFPLAEIASRASFEEMVYLLWMGKLPDREELAAFQQTLASQRDLPEATLRLLRESAQRKAGGMDTLRMAVSTLSLAQDGSPQDPILAGANILGRLPSILANYWRFHQGQEAIPARADLGYAANYLYMLGGETAEEEHVRALETYFNTVIDHGLNASTFTARVIISTGSDLVSAITGAIGALKGPLHGGAPGPALDMVFEIGEESRIEPYLRAKLERGERLMGFGHRIYKVRDPRADVLAQACERLYSQESDLNFYRFAKAVERKAIELLAEVHPGRNLQTNVEFYTALLLHGLGLPVELFTPTFTLSRAAGWIAHCFEQQRQNRLIRPQSEYIGEYHRRWIPLESRG